MREMWTAIAALAAGAAVMYYLDPAQGRRRRALARDQLVSASHDAGDFARARSKRAADRVRGLAARGRAQLRISEPVSDAQLRERIRSRLGRVVSHPRAIHVEVDQGHVRLSGPILAADLDPLISAVTAMRHVRGVENALTVHEEPGSIAGLQGPGRRVRSDSATLGSALPLMALAAAPMAILLGAAGRASRHKGNGAHVVH